YALACCPALGTGQRPVRLPPSTPAVAPATVRHNGAAWQLPARLLVRYTAAPTPPVAANRLLPAHAVRDTARGRCVRVHCPAPVLESDPPRWSCQSPPRPRQTLPGVRPAARAQRPRAVALVLARARQNKTLIAAAPGQQGE